MASVRIHLTDTDQRQLGAAILSTGLVEHGGGDAGMVGKGDAGEAFAKLFNKIADAKDRAG